MNRSQLALIHKQIKSGPNKLPTGYYWEYWLGTAGTDISITVQVMKKHGLWNTFVGETQPSQLIGMLSVEIPADHALRYAVPATREVEDVLMRRLFHLEGSGS